MKKTSCGWVAYCTLATILGCRAPSPDWNGTWKLNPMRSSFQGQVLAISITADGEYRFDEGNWSNTLRCDGKDRAIENHRTRVCVKRGVTELDITLKENGVKTRTTHDELSADGEAFTTTVTEFRPNGSVVPSQTVFRRLSGSDGFAGQWRDRTYLHQYADLTLRLDNQVLHIDYPRAGQHIDAPLNRVDSAVLGPHAPEGTIRAVRSAGSREFLVVTKQHGKAFTHSRLPGTEQRWKNHYRLLVESRPASRRRCACLRKAVKVLSLGPTTEQHIFPTLPANNGLELKAKAMKGRRVLVTGILHRADTVGEITPIYMNVAELKPVQAPPKP